MILVFIKKLYRAYQYVEDAEIALTKEYTRGVNDTMSKVKSQLNGALDTISKISQDAMSTSQNLSESFRTSISDEETRWVNKCKLCKKSMDAERYRIRQIQDELRDSMNHFSEIYSRLFKHASFVDSAHETILNSTAQVKASKHVLETIGKDYDSFKDRTAKIMELSIEDNQYVEERTRSTDSGYKPAIEASNVRGVVSSE